MTWPDAVRFDPFAGTASPAVEALLEGPGSAGSVVLLAVGALAQRGGWAAHTAVALADAFAARGESIILADLSLQKPELHAVLGVDNEEGLTDVFLFGASLQHAVRPVPGKWLRLIAAAPYTPDTREVLTHDDWSRVFEEVTTQKSKLVVYLPLQLEGARGFADRVGHVVVLADPYDLDDVGNALSSSADVIAVLMPPDVEAAPEVEPETPTLAAPHVQHPMERLDDSAFEKIRIPKDGAREALIADLRNRQRAALMAPQPAMMPLPSNETTKSSEATKGRTNEATTVASKRPARTSTIPVQPLFSMRAAQQPKHSRKWLIVVLILSLLVAASAGGWFWYSQGNSSAAKPAPSPARTAGSHAAVPTALPAGSRALPYSVAVASFQSFDIAQDQRDRISAEAAGIGFYVAPIVLQDKTFYRLMAGPVADSASASALRDTLLARKIKTISSDWDVLSTRYAFLVGEYAARRDAAASQQAAAKKGIPSYIVAFTGDDGSTSYRVYAGAFMGPGDADFMHGILKGAGLPDTLVERTGST